MCPVRAVYVDRGGEMRLISILLDQLIAVPIEAITCRCRTTEGFGG
jgi:hypothetical protein